jgi:hypothetical protein
VDAAGEGLEITGSTVSASFLQEINKENTNSKLMIIFVSIQ